MDSIACDTLRLRSFFRQFSGDEVPEIYYDFVRGDAKWEDLNNHEAWCAAKEHVWQTELGETEKETLHKTIRKRLAGESDWVLLGGPPCQAYSLIGRARMTGLGHSGRESSENGKNVDELKEQRLSEFLKDTRHTLYREYLRIVAVHQPAVFVMENVKGILSSKLEAENIAESQEKNVRVFSKIRDDLSRPWDALKNDEFYDELMQYRTSPPSSYKLYSFVHEANGRAQLLKDSDFLIRSENYGVPQNRHRVILLGVRDDISVEPRSLKVGDPAKVRDVLENMPPLRSGLSRQDDSATAWQKAIADWFSEERIKSLPDLNCQHVVRSVARRKSVELDRGGQFQSYVEPKITASEELTRWFIDGKLGGVIQHEARTHMASDLGRYLFVSAMSSVGAGSLTLDGWPLSLLPEHRNVEIDKANGRPAVKGFKDRFKVQTWDRPSSTVTAHISKDGHYFIHPDPQQCRSLTVREAARLQTFPDNYFFCGNRTQQYQQVGNAVPPFLAVQLAEVVARLLKGDEDTASQISEPEAGI